MKKFENLDPNVVKQLINYSNIIANLYNKLYELDINGKKKQKSYYNFIDFIKTMKVKEREIYESIPKDKLCGYIKYILYIEKLSRDIQNPNAKILFSEKEDYLTERILIFLEYMLQNNYEYEQDEEYEYEQYDDYLVGEILNFLECILQNNYEYEQNDDYEYDEDHDYEYDEDHDYEYDEDNDYPNDIINNINKFQDNAFNISIVFIDKLIKNIKNTEIKNQLKKLKYINSFTNPIVEDEYLFYGFNLSLNMYNFNIDKGENYISDFAFANAYLQIIDLFNKINYSDSKKFIIHLSLLKAYLCFLSNDHIEELIHKIEADEDSNPETSKVKTKIINEMKNSLNKNKN